MKVLVIDPPGQLLDMCLRGVNDGHEIKWWVADANSGRITTTGNGILPRVKSFEAHVRWADLIICGDNSKYLDQLGFLFRKGYPLFGYNPDGAQLELDRGLGQDMCAAYGMEIVPYQVFKNFKDAIGHVMQTKGVFVCKPWGGEADKALSYVSNSPEDMIYHLDKMASKGKLGGQIMLQEKIKGLEMAIGGWFGRHGWCEYLCENFEEKKFMNDNLGQNTGEQGTTVRYTKHSKLFDETLEPITPYLHKIGYVGYIDMNTMVRGKRQAAPLEFTSRFGYPLNNIQRPLHKSDEMGFFYGLWEGVYSVKMSEDISVGVCLTHGDFPRGRVSNPEYDGYPLYGLPESMAGHFHFEEVRCGECYQQVGDSIQKVPMYLTAGDNIMTVTGTGKTVSQAAEAAYSRIWKVEPPTNRMFRTDIACRLKDQLPELQRYGYAEGMKY